MAPEPLAPATPEVAALMKRRRQAVPAATHHFVPVFIERAAGSRVRDRDGREYIDFCGGIGALA